MARVVVTGGSGFIGTNLIEALLARGDQVVNLDTAPPLDPAQRAHHISADILDAAALQKAVAGKRFDAFIHLAGRTDCDERTTVEEGYRANTDGTANALATAREAGVARMIVTSSQFVFDRGPLLPDGDQDFHPVTVYGESKVRTERLTRDSGLPHWVIVRPTTVWGPWLARHRMLYKALQGGYYFHPSGPSCRRSYGYVGNVAHQYLRILDLPPSATHGRVLYVGDEPIELNQWVNVLASRLGARTPRNAPRSLLKTGAWFGDLFERVCGRRFPLDSHRLRSMTEDYLAPMKPTFDLLGPPRHSVEEGFDLTLRWLAAHPD